MANLSNAFGSVIMQAEKKETIDNLISLFNASGDWNYGDYGLILDDDISIRQDEKDCIARADFSGCGRNTFSDTVEFLMANLKRYLKKENALVVALEQEEFCITINYTDAENGYMVLYKEEDTLTHRAGTGLEDTRFQIEYQEGFDWTWANRIDLETEDLNSLMDCYHETIFNIEPEEWEQEEVENFLDEMEDELPDLVNLFGTECEFYQANPAFYQLYQTAKRMAKAWQ
ncbi:hypothetical protein EROP_29280 [Erysipelotrichaceae bacterium OPF54]|nr:hypothetical protein EROP_29280 [Erysipelotrichaceae bacterium OPF54]